METQKKPCEDRGGRQRLERCSHKPRNNWGPQSWERQGRILSSSLQREHGPPETLVSDLEPPELERITSCCSKPSAWW